MKSAWDAVRGLEPLSLCDWPGRVCAVVFFGGCNMKCPHCHNNALAWTPKRFPVLRSADLRRFFSARAKWLDGVVITGGEPTLTPGLPEFVADLTALDFPVKVDSNGMRPDALAEILRLAPQTAFSVDVKAPFEKYPLVTGGTTSAHDAEHNMTTVFRLAAAHPGAFMFRTTRVPELDEADLQSIGEMLPFGHELITQDFDPDGVNKGRMHAKTDQETRRLPGDVVDRQDRPGHLEGPQSQRHSGPAAGQKAG